MSQPSDLVAGAGPETFLSLLSAADRTELLAQSTPAAYKAGMTVVQERTASSHVLLQQSGWALATVSMDERTGRETVLRLYGPGDLVGEGPALLGTVTSPSENSETVRALTRVHGRLVPAERFRGLLSRSPEAVGGLLRVMLQRLETADRRAQIGANTTGNARLAALLVDLADQYGEQSTEGLVLPPLRQDHLAGWIHTSLVTTARTLRDWRERSLIRTSRGKITITDLNGLRKLADITPPNGGPSARPGLLRTPTSSTAGPASRPPAASPFATAIEGQPWRPPWRPSVLALPEAQPDPGQQIDAVMLGVDVVGYSARSTLGQRYVRERMNLLLADAFRMTGISLDECRRLDRGDGVLIVLPSSMPPAGAVEIADLLLGLLRNHNRISSDAAKIRLRLVAHTGTVTFDPHGMTGGPLVHLARLLDNTFPNEPSSLDFVLAVSDEFYGHLMHAGGGSPWLPADFTPTTVAVKETRTTAWLCTGYPSYRVRRGAAREST